jgi:hypothetical protein
MVIGAGGMGPGVGLVPMTPDIQGALPIPGMNQGTIRLK